MRRLAFRRIADRAVSFAARIVALGILIGVVIGVVIGPLPAGAAAPAAVPGPVTYPDGLVVRLAGLALLPDADGATCDDRPVCRPGVAAGDQLVRVTVSLSLPGSASIPIPLDVVAGSRSGIALLIGPYLAAADVDCGWLSASPESPGDPRAADLCTDQQAAVPTEIAPRGTVMLSEAFDVPSGEVTDAFTVVVQPPVVGPDGTNPLTVATFADAYVR